MQNLTCQNKARVNIQFGEAMNIAHLLLVIQFTNSPNVVFNLNNYKNTSINSVWQVLPCRQWIFTSHNKQPQTPNSKQITTNKKTTNPKPQTNKTKHSNAIVCVKTRSSKTIN